MAERDQHRTKIKRKFIDITNDIIIRDGVEAVSIRKIAALAKYNSATIYLYFDNLNHLLFLSSLSGTKDYIEALTKIGEQGQTSIDKVIDIWECFIKYSFERPKIFSTIFFSENNEKSARYMKEYYELYPEEISDEDNIVYKLIFDHDLRKRVETLLGDCSKEGHFKEADLEDLIELLLFAYKGMLEKVIKQEVQVDDAFKNKTLEYIKKILSLYVIDSEIIKF